MEGQKECRPTWILRLVRPCSARKATRGNSVRANSPSCKPPLNEGHAGTATEERTTSIYSSVACCHFDVTSYCAPQSPHPKLAVAGHELPRAFDISLPAFPSSSTILMRHGTERQHGLRGDVRLNESGADSPPVACGMRSAVECCEVTAETAEDEGTTHPCASRSLGGREAGASDPLHKIDSLRMEASAEEALYDLNDASCVLQSPSDDKCSHCQGRYADLHEGYDATEGFSHVIEAGPLLQAVEACDMDRFSAHTVVVASSHLEAGPHVSGTCSAFRPETYEEAWSDIVLTRGQDASCCVMGAAVTGTTKVSSGVQAPRSGCSLSIAADHADVEGFKGFCECVVTSQHCLQVRSRVRELPTVSCEKDVADVDVDCRTRQNVLGQQDQAGRPLSLPARLAHHICRRVRAYDQRRTNKSHLLVVGSTAVIGLTFAVLLVCIAHSLLDKNSGDGNRFLQ